MTAFRKQAARAKPKKIPKRARRPLVLSEHEISKSHSLLIDPAGLILFAMLAGGDYDTKGLPGCGPSVTMLAVKQGLGCSLCACRDQRECSTWDAQLADFLRTTFSGRSISVPAGFPDFKTLQKYRSPEVSSEDALRKKERDSTSTTYARYRSSSF
jgi:Holliday junction resolvase YEN1